jgi:hypothetical protein
MQTEHDTFLAILENMSGRATNKAMKQELGWSDADYLRVRAELKKAGTIILGRCRGGLVALKELNDNNTKGTTSSVIDPFPEGWRDLD